MTDAESISPSWLYVVIKTESALSAHGAAALYPPSMYIIGLIGLNMFTPTVSLTGGQKGALNFVKGLTLELRWYYGA